MWTGFNIFPDNVDNNRKESDCQFCIFRLACDKMNELIAIMLS